MRSGNRLGKYPPVEGHLPRALDRAQLRAIDGQRWLGRIGVGSHSPANAGELAEYRNAPREVAMNHVAMKTPSQLESLEDVCHGVHAIYDRRVSPDSPEGARIMRCFIDRLARIAEGLIGGANAKTESMDAAHEAFIAMWSVGFQRYGNRDRLSPVVIRVLRNKCMDVNRRRIR